MRWPFRRGETTTTESVTDSAGIAAPADAPADASADPPAPPAWTTLPVLQRTLDEAPLLTAPTSGMLGDVAERWTPVTALEPLGHDVGGLAPVGTIALAGGPIEAGGSGPELVDRPARPPLGVQRSGAPAATTVAPIPAEATPGAGDLPPRPEPFRLAVVADEPPAAMQRSLVSAANASGGVDHSSPTTASRVEVQPRTDVAPHAPVDRVDATVGVEPAATLQRATIGADPVVAPARRLGLGAPVARGGGGMPLQRTAALAWTDSTRDAAPAERAARPPRVPVQRLALDELPLTRQPIAVRSDSSAEVSNGADTEREPSPERPGPVSVDAASSGAPDAVPAAVVTGTIDVSRLAVDADTGPAARRAAAHHSLVRIQGDLDIGSPPSPTSPTLRLSRSATTESSVTGWPPRSAAPDARPVPIVAQAIGAPGAPGAPLPVQREMSASDVTLDMPPIATWRLDPTPGPAVADRGVDGPAPRTSPATGSGSGVAGPLRLQRTAAPSIAAPTASRPSPSSGPLVLARAQAPQTPAPVQLDVQRSSVAAPHEPASPDPVAPSLATSPADGFDLEIQRATDDAVGATPPPAVATSTPGGGGPAGGSDQDLDELARRLYERIRRRLLGELLADRERAGMLTDLR